MDDAERPGSARGAQQARASLPLEPAQPRRLASRLGLPSWDADDVAQDACERILQDGGELDPSARSLVRAVRGAARKHRRRAHREAPTRSGDVALDMPDERPDPEARAIERSRAHVLWMLLQKIDVRRCRVLVQHELDGATLAEIAAREGITEEAAKKRLQGARKDLDDERIRWQSEQKRRGRPTSPILLPLAQDVSVARRRTSRLGGAVLAVFVGLVAGPDSRWMFVGSGSEAGEPPPTVQLAAPSPTAPALPSVYPGAEPTPAPPAAPAPLPTRGSRARAASTIDDDLREEVKLVERAAIAVRAGQNQEAHRLIEEHSRRYPEGRLKLKRNALMRALDAAPAQ